MTEDLAQIHVSENGDATDVFWEPPLPASASDCIAELPDGSRLEPQSFGVGDERFGFTSVPPGTRIVRGEEVVYTVTERR
jgi:hypothetical protein